jgi:hypothetical protein
MTRAEWTELAGVISDFRSGVVWCRPKPEVGHLAVIHWAAQMATVDDLARRVAGHLKSKSPRFNVVRFLTLCGVSEDG